MRFDQFHAAFITRLAADSTLVNTYLASSSAIYFGQVPSSGDLTGNSLVVNMFLTGNVDTADKDIPNATVEFVAEVLRDGAQGPDAVLRIMERLYGDAIEQAGNVPTYGFHRLANLPLTSPHSTNYKLFGFRFAGMEPVDSDRPETYLAYRMTFDFHIQTL